MKRLLLPATTLTPLTKLAFTLLCCTVLMVFAAPAQTIQQMKADPYPVNDGPPPGAILDLAQQPSPNNQIPGGGNETYKYYTVSFTASAANTVCGDGCFTQITFAFRDDPAQISFANVSVVDQTADNGINLLTNGNFSGGVYPSNGNNYTPIGWTYVNTYGAAVEPGPSGYVTSNPGYCYNTYAYCWFDGTVQAYDAISQAIATTVGHTYQISFYVAEDSAIFATSSVAGSDGFPAGYLGSNCWLAAQTGGPPCTFSDLSTNGDTADPGGNGINVTVYALAGLPPATQLTLTELGEGAGNVTDTYNTSVTPPPPINCTEAGGTQTGTCSESDAPGTMVTLTETPSGSSTFGGWGGACASQNPSTTCTLTMNSSQTVTASFIAPPVTQALSGQYCSSGSPNSASTTYCPNNIYSNGVCQDPNGVVFTVEIPVVVPQNNGPQCFSLQATATEVTGTGLCPASQVGSNGEGFPTGPTTDFDCRFVSFYNYGTDASGDVYTPLCYPYFNGNCVYYSLQLNENGGPVPATETPAGVLWQVNINPSNAPLPPADQFTPPLGYSSLPRMLLDPGEDEVIPSMPWGTDCTMPMNMEANSGTVDPFSLTGYSTPYINSGGRSIYCQFDTDITTSFVGKIGGDAPTAGGKSGSISDIVLAFEPTTLGTGATAPPPGPVAPAISLVCDTGCTPLLGTVPSLGTITFTEGTPGTAVVTETVSPNPAPTLTITMGTTTNVTATDSGTTVTLAGTFGPQFVPGAYIVVDGCVNYPAYDGSFLITSGGSPGTTLTYTNGATGMGPDTCMVTALPAGLTFNLNTGVLAGTPADGAAGSYPITFAASNGVSPAPNATMSYTLTVNQAALTITASSATVAYGTGIPVITPTISGLVNKDMASVLGTITCSAAVPAGNPVGTYKTTCSGASDPTYTITYLPGTLQITAVPLMITASSSTITYGTTPVVTPIYSGFVNGDGPGSLTTQPTCTTTATSSSPAGSYPSTCIGAVDPNYTISYTPGTVTVVGLEISPLTVNFGKLYLGQIGVQGVILKNTGTTPITITSINHAGGTAPSDYGDLSFCPPMILSLPATLPAGKSCAIGVGIWATAKVFSPTPSTTYLTITDSAATQTVLLTAQVTDPMVSLSSTSLSFGQQKTGTTSTAQKVTLTNSGLTPLQLTGLTISGNFALTSGAGTNCTTLPTLSPGTTCFIYVTFTPTSKGSKSGSVTITDLTLFGKQTISLTGTGD